MPKLSLTQKGILLVSIPLCFEVAFVALFASLQREADAEAARAVKAQKFADGVNDLVNDMYAGFNAVRRTGKVGWLSKGNLNSSYKLPFMKLKADCKNLVDLTADDPELNKIARQSQVSINAAQDILDTALDDIMHGKLQEVIDRHTNDSQHLNELLAQVMSQQLLLIAKNEREVAGKSPEKQAAIRSQLMNYAFIAVSLNIVMTVALAVLWVKGITARLAVLNDNAARISSNRSLNPRLKGSDEIAELDGAFHRMSRALDEAAQAKQEFISMLTHDLRSPLGAIRGCHEILETGRMGELNEKGKNLLKLADRNSDRMLQLINDILDFHKIQSGQMILSPSDVPLAALFAEIAETLSGLIDERGLQLHFAPTPLVVAADQYKLERVLVNLISNAMKYSPANGVITVAARQAGQFVEMTVADQGPGIPEDMRQVIFERFQQVNPKADTERGGSGLGLAICKAIVELHGGKIWVECSSGVGSTFHFTIPAATSPHQTVSNPERQSERGSAAESLS